MSSNTHYTRMRALTPARRHLGRAGLPACFALPSYRSIPNHVTRPDIVFTTSTCPVSFRLRRTLAGSSLRTAESGSSPTDRQFTSSYSPPRFTATQFPSVTGLWLPRTRTSTVLIKRPHGRTRVRCADLFGGGAICKAKLRYLVGPHSIAPTMLRRSVDYVIAQMT